MVAHTLYVAKRMGSMAFNTFIAANLTQSPTLDVIPAATQKSERGSVLDSFKLRFQVRSARFASTKSEMIPKGRIVKRTSCLKKLTDPARHAKWKKAKKSKLIQSKYAEKATTTSGNFVRSRLIIDVDICATRVVDSGSYSAPHSVLSRCSSIEHSQSQRHGPERRKTRFSPLCATGT